jgi:hypothetical protein
MKGISDTLAAQNNRRESEICNGARLLQKTAQTASNRRGIRRGGDTKRENSSPAERPAIIENRGKKSGLSITTTPSHYSDVKAEG